METLLLGFCLISFSIASILVFFELLRERGIFKKAVSVGAQSETSNEQEDSSTVFLEKSPASESNVSRRVFEVLQQQLSGLGYHSGEQQMFFLNRLLRKHYSEISELSPQELRKIFASIQRYQSTQEEHMAMPLAQSA